MVKIGYNSYLGFAEQATFTTAVQPTNFLEFYSENFKENVDEILIDAINGTAQYKKRLQGQKNISGDFEIPIIPGSITKLLKHSIGTVTETTLTAGVYQYVFVARDALMPSSITGLTFQVARDTGDKSATVNYLGCKINTIAFGMELNNVLRSTVNVMGKDSEIAGTVATASYIARNPYSFANAVLKIGSAAAAETTTAIESLNINIENNLTEYRSLGNRTVDKLEFGMQDVTLEITKEFENNTLYNKFINGERSYISAFFTAGSIDATYTHSLKFEFYNCYFNGDTGNIGSPGELVKTTFPIRSIYDAASSSSCKITIITNTQMT